MAPRSSDVSIQGLARRAVLSGALGAGLLTLSGCATLQRTSYVEAVRRLLAAATRTAMARLTGPDGFWTSTVARINLPVLFGKPGGFMKGVLSSQAFRDRLQRHLNRLAEDGARRAAPLLADTVRRIGVENAQAVLAGGPTAATTLLRDQMGAALVNAMIPALGEAIRAAEDPILGTAVAALQGVNLADAAHALALEADNAIWYEIGAAEAAIRADPATAGDPLLAGALRAL